MSTREQIEKLESDKDKLVKKFESLHERASEIRRKIIEKNKEIDKAYHAHKLSLK